MEPTGKDDGSEAADTEAAAELDTTPLTAAEKAELRALRRENRQLRQDYEILSRAKAFFERDTH
jgi:transposase-like protein